MKKYLVKLNQEQRQEFWRTKQTFVALIRKMEEVVYLDGNKSGVCLIPADRGPVARMPRLPVQYGREEVREWWRSPSMNTGAILQKHAHRQTPLPEGEWIMRQSWRDLLFAHWPLAAQTLRPLIPAALTLDTFEREAWVGIVPFQMREVCPRGIPALPWFSASPELNVRTYVTVQGVPGVYFFSLDAAHPLFVAIARAFFSLPYFHASMSVVRHDKTIHFSSLRTRPGDPPAAYQARYRPIAPPASATPASLPFWLTERYCLYTLDTRGQVYQVDIHHGPWSLQAAELETIHETMARSHGILLPDTTPLLHYAQQQDTLAWLPRRIELSRH